MNHESAETVETWKRMLGDIKAANVGSKEQALIRVAFLTGMTCGGLMSLQGANPAEFKEVGDTIRGLE